MVVKVQIFIPELSGPLEDALPLHPFGVFGCSVLSSLPLTFPWQVLV